MNAMDAREMTAKECIVGNECGWGSDEAEVKGLSWMALYTPGVRPRPYWDEEAGSWAVVGEWSIMSTISWSVNLKF